VVFVCLQVDLTADALFVDGRRISAAAASALCYFAVNKPAGYICSNVSKQPGKRAVDLLQPWLDSWQLKHKVGRNSPLPVHSLPVMYGGGRRVGKGKGKRQGRRAHEGEGGLRFRAQALFTLYLTASRLALGGD